MIPDSEYDLVVIGAGAGGMTAAAVAAAKGLTTLLIESENVLGGTTAISAGSLWVPNSMHSPDGADTYENARRYMDATVGNHSPASLKEAFLRRGPEMVRFLADNSDVELRAYAYLPDYLPEIEGSTVRGRGLETVPFDGRRLGDALSLIKPPLPEFTIFGGMMVDRTDIRHLLAAGRSLESSGHALRILLRHFADRLRHPRGTRLVMGNALVARLVASLRRHGVAIATSTRVDALAVQNDRIIGVEIAGRTIRARRGVVLATGGFSHDPELRASLLAQPTARYSAVPASNAGGGVRLGLSVGGRIGTGHENAAFWAPASIRRRADGSVAVFPHFVLDRGKPGLIAVGRDGRRFVNEATSYQLFVEAMYRTPETTIPAFLICDRDFLRRYGLGVVRPRQRSVASFVKEGYLAEAGSLKALAEKIGVDGAALEESVARANGFAKTGLDADFGKGDNVHNRNVGDPEHGPNPCLGTIGVPPFYALTVHPADIGTTAGLLTDELARVMGPDGEPLAGLYAVGNDMHSVMGGVYPGPGSTLGPAMTFGYIAATHAAESADQSVPPAPAQGAAGPLPGTANETSSMESSV